MVMKDGSVLLNINTFLLKNNFFREDEDEK
jgi:hypothetical protein